MHGSAEVRCGVGAIGGEADSGGDGGGEVWEPVASGDAWERAAPGDADACEDEDSWEEIGPVFLVLRAQ
ncbi:hypothetical protein E2562_018610 [Oryza meyeriana var. granulata]|uniref:Uncharacterized protein n=1 Tax=Oryza meyeriana var. granulata TaxID=110450 RepID=A0A6G1BY28_9ORYZ|nr:hypothetical protein E2562_018610 [Oryza meyeriana var. granulata]